MTKSLKLHNFYVDEKVTIWIRQFYEIPAETEEEAKKIIVADFKDAAGSKIDTAHAYFTESEMLFETQEAMHVKENNNRPTMELFDEQGNKLGDNT